MMSEKKLFEFEFVTKSYMRHQKFFKLNLNTKKMKPLEEIFLIELEKADSTACHTDM